MSTVLVGVPFAFCLARLPIGGKPVLLALAALPLVLPSFVGAYALVLLFGRSGLVTGMLQSIGIPFESIYGAKGIIAVYTLTLYPYVVLPVTAAFKSVDVSVEEAAQNLGSSRARMLRTVTLPLVLPSILAGGCWCSSRRWRISACPSCSPRTRRSCRSRPISCSSARQRDNPASAGVLGVLLVVCTVAALLIQRAILSRRRYATGARRSAPLLEVSPLMRRLGAAYCWIVVGAALVPFAAVVVISFMEFRGPVLHFGLSTRQFRAAVPALVPAAHQHAAAGDAGGLRRHADRRSHRLHRGAPSLQGVGADRCGGDLAVCGRRHRARHRACRWPTAAAF